MLAGVLMAHTVELDGAAGKSQDAAKDVALEEYGMLAALLLGESAAPTGRLCTQCRLRHNAFHDRLLMLRSSQETRREEISGLQWELQPLSVCCCFILH